MTRENQGFKDQKGHNPLLKGSKPDGPREQNPVALDSTDKIEKPHENEQRTPPSKRVRSLEEDTEHVPRTAWPTPLKAGVKFCVEFLEHKGIPFNRTDVFKFANNMPPRTGYRVLAGPSSRRLSRGGIRKARARRVDQPKQAEKQRPIGCVIPNGDAMQSVKQV